jgi:hypothetical protein
MKLNGLRELVKEELKRALHENMNEPSFLEDLELGAKYKVYYRARDNQGEKDLGNTVISITQDDINKHGGNKSIQNYLTSLFNMDENGNPIDTGYTVNGIRGVEKLTNNMSELKKEINEIVDDILEETQLEEIMTSQINVGDVFTLSSDIGLFKRGDRVEVKDKGMYGNDVKLILSNNQGITDEFLLDIDDDFEALT